MVTYTWKDAIRRSASQLSYINPDGLINLLGLIKKHLDSPEELSETIDDFIEELEQYYTTPYTYTEQYRRYTYNPPVIQKDFEELEREVDIFFNSEQSLIILRMMTEFPNTEWGAYIVHPEISMDTESIDVKDILVIPQITTAAAVEYMDQEIPELCPKLFEYIEKGYSISRVHSHHTLQAFHSATDEGELKKAVSRGETFASLVFALEIGTYLSPDEIFENLDIDAVICFPQKTTAKYGSKRHAVAVFDIPETISSTVSHNVDKWVDEYKRVLLLTQKYGELMTKIMQWTNDKHADFGFSARKVRESLLGNQDMSEFLDFFTQKVVEEKEIPKKSSVRAAIKLLEGLL